MTATLNRTETEVELSRQFQAVAPELPGAGWVPEARARAMRAFEKAGLPHRRIEAWKYTDLRNGLKAAYPLAIGAQRKPVLDELAAALGPEFAALPCIRLVLLNGHFVSAQIPAGHEPGADWQFEPLSGALDRPGHEWLQAGFEADAQDAADAVRDLNTAFATDGIVLAVAGGARLRLPVHIVSLVTGREPVAVATRNVVRLGAGAHAIVIESHLGIEGAASVRQATNVTRVEVGSGAELHHIQIVSGGAQAVHLCRWEVAIAAKANYRGYQLTAGAGLVRNESLVRFDGPDARLDLSGLMLGRGNDHIDTTLVVDHRTTGCESRELFKVVLDGRARGVFQGKVVVAPEAQKTDGKQMAQALMLSEDAEFDSKPELEIYADDVACGHGATAAELDPDMLFYLRARGIPLPEARTMLIESFAAEALDKIEDEAIREAARAIAVRWLGGGR